MLFARAWYPEVPDSVRRHKALQLRDSSETKYVRVHRFVATFTSNYEC